MRWYLLRLNAANGNRPQIIMALVFLIRLDRDTPVLLRQMGTSVLGPFHEFDGVVGKHHVVESHLGEFLRPLDAVEVHVVDRNRAAILEPSLILVDDGEGGTRHQIIHFEKPTHAFDEFRLSSPKISVQNHQITTLKLRCKLLTKLDGLRFTF